MPFLLSIEIYNRDTIRGIITSYNVDGGTCERVVSYILFFPEFPEWQCEDRIIMNRKAAHSTRAIIHDDSNKSWGLGMPATKSLPPGRHHHHFGEALAQYGSSLLWYRVKSILAIHHSLFQKIVFLNMGINLWLFLFGFFVNFQLNLRLCYLIKF